MDLRGYDELIIENALKDENFKQAYMEMLYKLTSEEANKYGNFESFANEEADYLEGSVHYNQATFQYDHTGITLKICKDDELYYFYTYDIDFNNMREGDITKAYCGEMCGLLTKDDLKKEKRTVEFILRIAKINDEFVLIVVNGDPVRCINSSRKILKLDKNAVEDIIEYIEKVKSENFGV